MKLITLTNLTAAIHTLQFESQELKLLELTEINNNGMFRCVDNLFALVSSLVTRVL